MKDENEKESRDVDKKDEPNEKPPYVTCASIGGFTGGIVAHFATNTELTGFSWWRVWFVSGAAVVGALVGMGFYYIWVHFLKRFYE